MRRKETQYWEYRVGDIYSVRVYMPCPKCKKTLTKGGTGIEADGPDFWFGFHVWCSGFICPDHGEVKPRTRIYVPKETAPSMAGE